MGTARGLPQQTRSTQRCVRPQWTHSVSFVLKYMKREWVLQPSTTQRKETVYCCPLYTPRIHNIILFIGSSPSPSMWIHSFIHFIVLSFLHLHSFHSLLSVFTNLHPDFAPKQTSSSLLVNSSMASAPRTPCSTEDSQPTSPVECLPTKSTSAFPTA